MKIRTQILATLGVVAVLPAVSLLCMAHRETATEIGRRLDRSLGTAAERAATLIDGFLIAHLEEVRSLATLPSMEAALVGDAEAPRSTKDVQRILTMLEARDPVNSMAFGLVDAQGRVIVDAEPRCIGTDEAGHRYFRETLATSLPWASHEDWSNTGDRVLVVASPVRNTVGAPIGALRLVLENATLQQILSAGCPASDPLDLALFDQDGRLVADTWWPTKRHEDLALPAELRAASNPVAHFAAWIGADGKNGAPGRAVLAPLAHSGWGLMAWQPKHAYEAELTELGHQRWWILGTLLALLAAAAWLASRWIARPIQRLEWAATQIANGDLDSDIPASSGEVGTLAATLQVMRHRLLSTMHELQEAAIDAHHASAAKSQFMANMSHELRTPLTAILGFSELLASAPEAQHEARQQAATIHRNAGHLLALVNEVLDLAKVESGTMDVHLSAFSPADLGRQIVDMLQMQATKKRVALRCQVGNVPATMRSDEGRLRQILINLVGNALKFTDVGEVELSMHTRAEDGQLLCEVRDTGPGINPERLGALFHPFSQIDGSTSRRHGGIGLGLAISRKLARTLGGDIVVRSEVGKGCTFALSLPAHSAPEAAPAAPAQAKAQIRLQGRILVVEDGADNRRLLSHILRQAGAEVELAENGLLGLQAMCTDGDVDAGLRTPPAFDLVLMDMQMPVMDGLTATRQLRQLGLRIPVIALTAHAMDEARQQCADAGCDEWATKPIAAQALVGMCATWLARRAEVSATAGSTAVVT